MSRQPVEIRVGMGSCGIASGAESVRDALDEAARRAGAEGLVKAVGCNGMCHHEPLVEVVDNGRTVLYGDVLVDEKMKFGILSGDHLVPYLATKLGAARVVIAAVSIPVIFETMSGGYPSMTNFLWASKPPEYD